MGRTLHMKTSYGAVAFSLFIGILCRIGFARTMPEQMNPLAISGDRQLFVDSHLIETLHNVRQQLHTPQSRGPVFAFDRPWEGRYCAYVTILHHGDQFQMYYRGLTVDALDGSENEVTCYAQSSDGIHWNKPDLGLYEVNGTKQNNVLLAHHAPYSHNFSPLIDSRPGVPAQERYKAIAGVSNKTGLSAFVSGDGVRWKPWGPQPVFNDSIEANHVFDSQNVAFWSDSEQCFVLYYRVYKDNIRSIARATSRDFLNWTPEGMMQFSNDAPTVQEQLYTNQTSPYFRAPQVYISLAARFMEGRSVFTPSATRPGDASSAWLGDNCSDVVLMSSRVRNIFDRTFPQALVRPGPDPRNWASRGNYAALGIIPTGPTEMSLFVQREYGLPNHYLERLALRLDGFASISAPHEGGELLTRPLTFSGKSLEINFATSAAGGIRVEIQDLDGKPIRGYALSDCHEIIGDEIARTVHWSGGADVSALAGKPLRLRFWVKEADLYSFRFFPG